MEGDELACAATPGPLVHGLGPGQCGDAVIKGFSSVARGDLAPSMFAVPEQTQARSA